MLRVRAITSGWEGGPGLMTFYFLAAPEDAAAALSAVTRVRSDLAASASLFPNIWTAQVSGDVDVLNVASGAIENTLSVASPAAVVGAATDASFMAPATALILRLSTATFIAGRRLRGRIFLSPLYSAMADGTGTPTVAAIAAGLALGNALMVVHEPEGPAVIWHRPKLGVGGQTGVVVAASVNDKFGVLKSRRD